MAIVRGLIGILAMLLICYALSNNRKAINWKSVAWGVGLQMVFAVSIMHIPFVERFFDAVSGFFVLILNFTQEGADFVLGKWPDNAQITDGITSKPFTIGYVFVFKVLPTIIFFSAFSSLLYYLGVLQFIIKGIAWCMVKTMGLTGPESLSAAANVFIGQSEAPLVIKPYLDKMSDSEIMCLMTGGMATIAGGVFAAYIGFLGGSDPAMQQLFATHLLAASIISAPAAIVAAKILMPETREVDLKNQKLDIPKSDIGSNMLDAISNGTTDGIKLAVNVGAMLLVFTAFVAMINYVLLNGVGNPIPVPGYENLNDFVSVKTGAQFEGFNLEFILGILFTPVAWLIGIEYGELMVAGQLLGIKTTLNEFFAYAKLPSVKEDLSERSVVILTYALCGFANFASIGIQIGGIGAIAPAKREALTRLGVKALVGGTIACLMTGAVAGMFYIG